MRIKFTIRTMPFLLLAALLLAACGGESDDSGSASDPKTVQFAVTGEGADHYVFRNLESALPVMWRVAEGETADYEVRIDASERSKVCHYVNYPDITVGATDAAIQLVHLASGDVLDEREFEGTLTCPRNVGQSGSGGPSLTLMQSWAFTTLGQHMGLDLRIQSHAARIARLNGFVVMHPTHNEFLFHTFSPELEVLDADTLEQRLLFSNDDEDNTFMTATYSPDGQWIAAGRRDGTVTVWDAQTGAETQTFTHDVDEVASVQFSADSTRLVASSTGPFRGPGAVVVWDTVTGTEVYRYDTEHNIKQAIFSPNDRYLAISDGAGIITIVDLENSDAEPVTFQHRGSTQSISFTPDSTRLMTLEYDGDYISLWNIADGSEVLTIQSLSFSSANLSPDGKTIVTTTTSKIVIWDAKTGAMLHESPQKDKLWNAEFSPNGHTIIAYGESTLWILDTKTWQPIYWLMGHNGWVKSAVFTPDYRWLISSGSDSSIRQWDTSALAE